MSNFYCKQAILNLLSDGNWRTAASIQLNTGYTPLDVRKTCQQYTQLCISSGEGYKLVKFATSRELSNSLRILMSRANKINKRARSLQRFMLERERSAIRAVTDVKRLLG